MLCHLFRKKKKDTSEDVTDLNLINNNKRKKTSINHHNWFSSDVILLSKDFNYIITLLEQCIKFCSNPDIHLKNNPPYLSGTLRSFQTEILGIIKHYKTNLEELSKIFFFKVVIWTLVKQCTEIMRIFRCNKIPSINEEESKPRQKLIQISLLLSHLYHGLVALFPNQYYAPELFRITKSDAAEWWHSQFGNKTVVEWNDFFHVFSKIYYISDTSQILALRRTISITGNGFVTIYDFDIFVRLFGPWSSILECWRRICHEHPGCMSLITYEQALRLLTLLRWQPGSGSYIFRFSCTRPGQWAIGYVDGQGDIYQTIVQNNKSIAVQLTEGFKAGIYRYPNGNTSYDNKSVARLLQLTKTRQQQLINIPITKEQHDAYCKIDSTFEVCKICSQNNKNIRLEPCGHLLCSNCLNKWQKSFPTHTCPFCRLEIKGIENVSLLPYEIEGDDSCESLLINNLPKVPPRLTLNKNKTSSSPVDLVLPSTSSSDFLSNNGNNGASKRNNVNYAKLDWRYKDDYEDDDDHNLGNNDEFCDNDIDQYRTYNKQDSITTQLQPTTSPKQVLPSSSSPASPSSNEAIHKLFKITNDLDMSTEILKHFAPRSITIN